ncbi:hypothetical protein BDR07DRAFT_1494623 [Suillus spraguei]|nr:hypothetical protein BDR07DRAFT_1494623 [Suillus spraguei]
MNRMSNTFWFLTESALPGAPSSAIPPVHICRTSCRFHSEASPEINFPYTPVMTVLEFWLLGRLEGETGPVSRWLACFFAPSFAIHPPSTSATRLLVIVSVGLRQPVCPYARYLRASRLTGAAVDEADTAARPFSPHTVDKDYKKPY